MAPTARSRGLVFQSPLTRGRTSYCGERAFPIFGRLDGNINNIVNFKLLLPRSRKSDNEIFITSILKYLNCEVIGLHINYNNRPETKQEQEFLEKWCFYNNIKLYVKSIDNIKRDTSKRSDYETITKKIICIAPVLLNPRPKPRS